MFTISFPQRVPMVISAYLTDVQIFFYILDGLHIDASICAYS